MDLPEKEELVTRYQNYTDEELLTILQHPKDYQEAAVDAARELAFERGIEWAEVPAGPTKTGFAFFPRLSSPESALNLIKSLQRILYLVALVPLIAGALSYTDGYPTLAIAYGGIAIVWGVLSMLTVRRKRHQMVLLLFLLLGFMAVLRYITAGLPVGLKVVDWTVWGIAAVALVYILLYFKFLVRNYMSRKS